MIRILHLSTLLSFGLLALGHGVSPAQSVLSLGVLATSQSISSAEACLSRIPNLEVLNSSSPHFPSAKKPFNLRFEPSPDIITYPISEQQVPKIITCAVEASVSVSARSGGHSYAAYGLYGEVVVDLSKLKGLTMNYDGTVIVQTGNRLGNVAMGIFDQGGRALAHGSCPYVGSGGHTVYGGFGYYSRIGGLLSDQVVSAQVALANGALVTASDSSHTDLFWAIRGGGPSFGIVTSWTFRTLLAPPTTVKYNITFGQLSEAQMVSAYLTWQSFAPTAPKELAMAAFFGVADGALFMHFAGTYYGPEIQFRLLMKPLIAQLPASAKFTAESLGWIAGLKAFAGNNGSLDTSKPDVPDTFFVKSLITTKASTATSITSWIHYLRTEGPKSDTDWFAQVDLYGGVISNIPSSATPFVNRNAFLVYQLYASSKDHQPPYPENGIKFVDDMLKALEPNPQAAYANYIDPTLTKEQWQQQYFGSNVARLERIKKEVDPKNVFKLSQGF